MKGEGGLDDATGTNKFGGGASMKQSSSVVDLTKISEKDDEDKVGWVGGRVGSGWGWAVWGVLCVVVVVVVWWMAGAG